MEGEKFEDRSPDRRFAHSIGYERDLGVIAKKEDSRPHRPMAWVQAGERWVRMAETGQEPLKADRKF